MSSNFKKRLLWYMAPLIFVTLVLIVVVQSTGVRIRSVNLEQDAPIQSLSLRTSSQLASVDSVSISPDILFRTNKDNFGLTLIFEEPLRYDQDYQVSIQATDKEAKPQNLQTEFKTDNPPVFYLSRNKTGPDRIIKSGVSATADTVVYESETILVYALSRHSILCLNESDDTQSLHVVEGNNSDTEIIIPSGHEVRSIDGSKTEDSYILSLLNNTTYETTLWFYNNESQTLQPAQHSESGQIQIYFAQFAPDGKSVFYVDVNQNVILDIFTDNEPGLTLGVFSNLHRVLPNQSGLFGFTQNKYLTVLSSDGSEIMAPDIVQSSFLPTQFATQKSYVYTKQSLDENRLKLLEKLIVFDGTNENIITEHDINEHSIIDVFLSPNDQFIITEEADSPIIYDGLSPNGQFGNVRSVLRDSNTGEIKRTLDGFDVKWRL